MKQFFRARPKLGAAVSGALAGIINGLFGAGGGMLLLPALERLSGIQSHEAFASSVCIILPLCLVSAGIYFLQGNLDIMQALPYLIGGAAGGVAAGLLLKRLPAVWLHRALGAVIVFGGLRLLLR